MTNTVKKCEYCGYDNGDHARKCLGCGTQFLVTTEMLREFEASRHRPLWLSRLGGLSMRQTQLISALAGVLITVGMVMPIVLDGSDQYAIQECFIAALACWPAGVVGLTINMTVGNYSAASWFVPTLFSALINALLLFLAATVMRAFLRRVKSKVRGDLLT